MEGQENLKTPRNKNAKFDLVYNDLTIGYLSLQNGEWKFEYSDAFKKQNEIIPIVDFPDKKKSYASEQLWPFFSYRIPGLDQPSVREAIARQNIDESNEVDLLKYFGKFSVFSPFQLKAAF